MAIHRRKFIRNSIAGTSAALMTGALASCAETADSPIVDKPALKSMTDGVVYITKNERLERIEKARKLMGDLGLDAIYLDTGTSMRYFVDVSWGSSERMMGVLIPKSGSIYYICPKFEDERLNERISLEGELRTWEEHESPYELVGKILKELNLSAPKIGMEERVRFFIANGIRKANPRATIVDGMPVVAGCRRIKSSSELALMQIANEITLEAYRIGYTKLEVGMSQYDLNNIVKKAYAELGGEGGGAGASFGEYTAFPHGSKEISPLKEGDNVLIDGGCIVGGYQADITRTAVFGKPTQRQRDIWDVVKEAQSKVYEVAQPGVPCELLDATARAVVEKAGFGSDYTNFFHRVGHGIGMDFHEWEYLVRGNKTLLEPGMCFSNEPGIYLYGEFGVRLEDCWYVTENGYKAFTPQSPSVEQAI